MDAPGGEARQAAGNRWRLREFAIAAGARRRLKRQSAVGTAIRNVDELTPEAVAGCRGAREKGEKKKRPGAASPARASRSYRSNDNVDGFAGPVFPFRGVGCTTVESNAAGNRPALPRDWDSRSEVPRRIDRAFAWNRFRPSPCDLRRFRPGPSGLLSPTSPAGATPPVLLSSGCPSPRSGIHRSTAPACAWREHLSWGSCPYSARQKRVPAFPEIPSSGTIRPQGFSPSRRLPSPTTLQGLFHPRCALGVPPDLRHSQRPFDRSRATAPGFPLQGFLPPRDEPVLAGSPLSHLADGKHPVKGTNAGDATQSLDHRRVGVSHGSYPRAPAFLRFSADHRTRGFEAFLLGPWVAPSPSGNVAAPLQPLRNLSRPYRSSTSPTSLPRTRQPTALSISL